MDINNIEQTQTGQSVPVPAPVTMEKKKLNVFIFAAVALALLTLSTLIMGTLGLMGAKEDKPNTVSKPTDQELNRVIENNVEEIDTDLREIEKLNLDGLDVEYDPSSLDDLE